MIPNEFFYRKMFFIGAVWNYLATLSFIFGYRIIFPLLGMQLPIYPVFFLLFLGLAFVFGIGYQLVSRDIYKNRAVVVMGIYGKLIVSSGLTYAALTGNISRLMIGPGLVDLIFAILFIKFLSQAKKHN